MTLVALLAVLAVATAAPLQEDVCGYESCPKADHDTFNIHIVPHTHDDVGWLKTVDQYYYGSRSNIQLAGVQYILDSVVEELWKDESRRFIYVETAFFWKWWTHQNDDIKQKVRKLVNQGRLEFIGGAWSMNDEADVRYQSTIDQFTWGLRKLNETFGACARPRVAWQIDPFGHSREFASLVAAMGYDGLFHGRIDYQDKRARVNHKNMEMVWRGDDDLGAQSDLFTGILYNTYSPPPGFCFDILCRDEPIIDDVTSPMYNVDRRVGEFLNYSLVQSFFYQSNNIMMTMGGDFTYQMAGMYFRNLDLLIRHANLYAAKNKLHIKMFYSTPSCYLKAVNDAKVKLPTKRDDFMPYASDPHSYWTGYFTSRPCLKYFERRGNAYLQMVNQLQVFGNSEEHNMILVNELKSAMGVMQHHDAVTGTEKQHVAFDYARILNQAIEDGLFVVKQALSKLIEKDPENLTDLQLTRCQFNVSSCGPSEHNKQFSVVVYNPLTWQRTKPIRLPVRHGNYVVYDHKGNVVESQLVQLPASLLNVVTRHSVAVYELVFVTSPPPLGFAAYYVTSDARSRRSAEIDSTDDLTKMVSFLDEAIHNIDEMMTKPHPVDERPKEYQDIHEKDPTSSQIDDFNMDKISEDEIKQMMSQMADFKKDEEKPSVLEKKTEGSKFDSTPSVYDFMMGDMASTVIQMEASDDDYIENEHMRLSMNRATGELTTISLTAGPTIPFDVDLMYYTGWFGNNENSEKRSSGAYIFRPLNASAVPLDVRKTTKIIKGPIVQEIHQEYSNYTSTVIRLYKNSPFLEVEWLAGPIPVGDNAGKEIIIRYHTNLSNNEVFYTDSNGKQSLERVLNKRPQYDFINLEPVAGNYYPINSKIHIEDKKENLRFSVLNDRAQGGTSLNEGQIEIMIHRRLLHDDAFGVGEALNEIEGGVGLVVRGTHYIHIGKITPEFKQLEKVEGIEIVQPLEVLVSNSSKLTLDDWRWLNNEWSGLKSNLPKGVHLLTLEHWKKNELLVRLENVFEKADLDASDNGIRTVDLSTLFDFTLNSIDEMSLAANQFWKDRKRMEWDSDFDKDDEVRQIDGFKVDLKPSQIRTFILGYNRH